MPRDYEIKHAFMNAIRRKPGLGVTVTTQEFVRQLELLNWHFSLREANHSACVRPTSGSGRTL